MSVYVIATTDKVRVTSSVAITTLRVQGSAIESNASTGAFAAPIIIKASITNTTAADVLAGPGGSNWRTLKELTIRNEDASLTTDVTVDYFDNTTAFAKIKVTLAPGDVLEYTEASGWVYLTNAVAKLDKLLFVTGSDVSNNTTSFADITGLTVALKSGRRYMINAWLHVISAATTTGIQIGYNIGAAPTSSEFTANQVVTNSATASTHSTGEATARDTNFITQTTGPAAIGPAQIAGMIVPSADGTLALRLRSEVATSAVTVKIGSWMEVREER